LPQNLPTQVDGLSPTSVVRKPFRCGLDERLTLQSIPRDRQYLPRNFASSVGRTLADEYFWKNNSVTG
jgi:hypothetical protein